MKQFRVMYNVGEARYLISFHDGVKTHKDGSPFFDIAICKSRKELLAKVNSLKAQGYTQL